jgi:hypothetical protein
MQQFSIRFYQIPRWQLILGTGLFIVLLLTLFIFALGVFLLVLPVFLLAGALAYFFGGRRLNSQPDSRNDVIETEYRVIEQTRLNKDRDE